MARPNRSREAILAAAAELAASRGISATSMDDIAQFAGVSKGSLYYNFASKNELFGALFVKVQHDLVPALQEALDGCADGQDSLRVLIGEVLVRLQAQPALAKLLVAEIFRSDRNWSESVGTFRDSLAQLFSTALAAARPDLDDARSLLLASSSLGAVLTSGLEWLVFEPERSRDEVVDALMMLLVPLSPVTA